ncbi:MFS family membrane transporter [Schizosaccharomyces octosporus yFS286]|uniref:MFS family membrane transporter n=1 Tax=Schizosaccharomyces octosporus (strain yFS286) TaxID=483514 RepID=S9PUJ5_SCHOY|nr:MFS family membrane transporter [Schizosaccharomyces octosporus yFS286]EPX71637.1 MFS family membrane transporter [Schizosaccharomyces octosporus yFS286]
MDLVLLSTGKKFDRHYKKLGKCPFLERNELPKENESDGAVAANQTTLSREDKSVVSLGASLPLRQNDLEKGESDFHVVNKNSVEDPYLVTWDSVDDSMNPSNWTMARKWWIIIQTSIITIVVTFGSSIYSSGVEQAAHELHASVPVSTVGSCTFLVGFGFGSLPFAPLSGIYGRFIVYFLTLLLFTIFQIGGGCAQNIWTICILRFFQGVFGSTPLANAGGTISDMFNPIQRTYVLPGFCTFPYLGPIIGPIMGDFIVQSYLGWRWLFWINMIWAAGTLALIFFLFPETHGETILDYKARYLRKVTGNPAYYTIHERERDPKNAIFKAATQSVSLFLTEPIVVCFTLYLTVVYIINYINFEGYPIIYSKYGFNYGELGLSFIAVGVGIVVAGLLTPLTYKQYLWAYRRRGNVMCPEDRLYPLFIGAFVLPISMFWLAWTCYADRIHWIVPMIASSFFGFALLIVFFVSYNYIIDSYQHIAPSALAAATVVRYCASGGVTLAARPMYLNLGDHWATSVLGFISVAMVPIPFIFYKYGKHIRAWSTHAYKL